MLPAVHLHGVAQGARGAGDDGDLGHRGGVALEGGHQGVARLVVGHDFLLQRGENRVFALGAGQDGLHAFLQVLLKHQAPALPHRPEGGLVDDVSQLCAGGTGGGPGDGIVIHVLGDLHISGMDLQNGNPAPQVGQLHRHPPVEPAGAGEGGIQRLRPVGGGQQHHALAAVEAVHLGQKLVEGLLPLVVAPHTGAVPLLADGVDLVDEHDAGGLLIGLLEQVPDLGRPHAHEHLHELRPGDGEEGHPGLSSHSFGQQGLAGARRADQQHALGQLGPYLGVLVRVMEKVHHFHQGVFGLLLASYVGKGDTGLVLLYIHLGVGLSEGHGIAHAGHLTAHFLQHPTGEQFPNEDKHENRQHPGHDKGQQGAGLSGNGRFKLDAGSAVELFQQPFPRVRPDAGLVIGVLPILLFCNKHQLFFLCLPGHLADLSLVHHGQELVEADLGDLFGQHAGEQQCVEQHHHNKGDDIVKEQRFFRNFWRLVFDFLHHISFLSKRLVLSTKNLIYHTSQPAGPQ